MAEVTPQATSRKQGNPAGDGLQHPSPTTAAYLSDDIEGLRGGAEALAVLQESEQEVVRALALAEGITKSHPSLPAWLRSKQAAGEILTEQHAFLQHLGEAGERPSAYWGLGLLLHPTSASGLFCTVMHILRLGRHCK